MPDEATASGSPVSEGPLNGETDSSVESSETIFDGTETADSELNAGESNQKLLDTNYDSSEYETELMDSSYEISNQLSYEADSDVYYKEDGDPVGDVPIVVDDSFLVKMLKISTQKDLIKIMPKTNETLPPETIISRSGSERGRLAQINGLIILNCLSPMI